MLGWQIRCTDGWGWKAGEKGLVGRLIASQIMWHAIQNRWAIEYPNSDDISGDWVKHSFTIVISRFMMTSKQLAISQAIMLDATAIWDRRGAVPQVCSDRLFSSWHVVTSVFHWTNWHYRQLVMMSFVGWNPKRSENSHFTHFVADNVHHNIWTVNGHKTFHVMVLISVSHLVISCEFQGLKQGLSCERHVWDSQ